MANNRNSASSGTYNFADWFGWARKSGLEANSPKRLKSGVSTVGVLALQGDFQKHIDSVAACNRVAVEVRTPSDLESCSSLIIPGGESTTLGILLKKCGLDNAIPERVHSGMPIWGTCMGMILLASRVEGAKQFQFGLLDVTVRRNAFGRQVFSFESSVKLSLFEEPIEAVFIRAPIVTEYGDTVDILGELDGKIIAVRQGHIWGTSFHPELTEDLRLHKAFIETST